MGYHINIINVTNAPFDTILLPVDIIDALVTRETVFL